MKIKKCLSYLATLFTAFAVGLTLFTNYTVKPTKVEAEQHIANYDPYTYTGTYYNTFDFDATGGMNGALRTSLTTWIKPKGFYKYTGGSGSEYLATQLQSADEDPTNSNNMVYFYTRDSVTKNAASTWNREHVWCQSLSNNNWGTSEGGTDLLHIRPTYDSANSTRNNHPFGVVVGGSAKSYNGMVYGYYKEKVDLFEPLDSVKGDVARIIMYMWVAYTGWVGNTTYNSLNILDVFESYDTLLSWHTFDRPDVLEGNRNNYVESSSKQQNRNPFVDHPELAWKIFGDQASTSVKNACMEAYPANGGNNPIEPTGVELNRDSANLVVGNTLQLTASLQPNGATCSVTWSSNNESVATVSNTGLVTAIAVGNATITARVSENITATCSISVSSSGGNITTLSKVASYDFSTGNTSSTSEYDNDGLLTRFSNSVVSGTGLSNIVTGVSDSSKTYAGYSNYYNYGLKLGTGSANGTFTLALNREVTKVIVKTAGWATTDTLTVGDADAQTPGVAYSNNGAIKTLTYEITPSNSVAFTFAKRGFIQSIDFYASVEIVDSPESYLNGSASIATIVGNESTGALESTTSSVTFASAGLDDQAAISNYSIGGVTLNGDRGAHANLAPKYFNNGNNMRVYKGNTFTFTGNSISRIEFTFTNNYSTGLTVSVGSLTDGVWTGNANSVTFTNPTDNSDQVRITAISVTYMQGSLSVNNVGIRFGATINKESWNTINKRWPITDYGVMLVKKTTLNTTYGVENISAAYIAGKNLAIVNRGSNATPASYGHNYAFSVRLNITSTSNYSKVYVAAPFIVAGGSYYFLTQIEYSVNTLAAYCLTNGGSSLSNAALNVLAGN